MQIRWTMLPFPARSRAEFFRGLTAWLSKVFYETLPEQGFEVREEQIYTTFRMARALEGGRTLLAEAGSGTGKTFAYLLPVICYARFRGMPAVVASASGVLQAQLINPQGDIMTLSRLLDLGVDVRVAADPGEYLCAVKADRLYLERPLKGWKALYNWTRRTRTGARSEVPDTADDLWAYAGWDPSLPCDTCRHRGTCHVMKARREYRAAGDLIVTDHRLVARDLLSRAERADAGQLTLLPPYSALVLDEGHHMPETWQRAQGFAISSGLLNSTLNQIESYARTPGGELAEARRANRERLANHLVAGARQAGETFLSGVLAVAEQGEGKRTIPRSEEIQANAARVIEAVEALQDDLVTEEAMVEGTDDELTLRAYQTRLDELVEGLACFRSSDVVTWVEGRDLWAVPRQPVTLFGPGRLRADTPVLFSSATLEPEYMARMFRLPTYDASRVGVPFNLAEQVLVYQPAAGAGDPAEQVPAVVRAMQGRTLVLLNTLAEVEQYRTLLAGLPWQVFFEGDADRGAMLAAFRAERDSVLVGATFWEGVDVPGESLSCVAVPGLPFPPHDPLIRERRAQAAARGEDPFMAVDLPEMLLKLKQGAGRLIRTARDRGVLALLDQSYRDKPWAGAVSGVLPDGAERTGNLERVAAFCPPQA